MNLQEESGVGQRHFWAVNPRVVASVLEEEHVHRVTVVPTQSVMIEPLKRIPHQHLLVFVTLAV